MVITHTRIADLNIEFQSTYYEINAICRPFPADFTLPDITVIVEESEALDAYNTAIKNGFTNGISYHEANLAFRKLSQLIVDFDAFVLHGAAFSIDNSGVIFCAASGTGKTTHMLLWEKTFPGRMKIINGDKPIIRFIGGVPYAYGTPWNGKEHFGCNDRILLKNICFIERSDINEVLPIDKKEATQRLSLQMVQQHSVAGLIKNMEFIDKLLDKCKISVIRCNMEPEAAIVAHKAICEE